MAKRCPQSIGIIMETIIVDKPITFNVGAKLRLSVQQVAARPLSLAPVKGEEDVYHVMSRVVFKRGEEIGIEEDSVKKRSDEEKIVRPKHRTQTKKRLLKSQVESEVKFAPEEDPVDSEPEE